ncbi:hypothetical protein B0H67DRAFT_58188 [Lasiosphaeris hirsuta]|uniref:Uncharacterized protein n=1 Tax=Lasiosphaeris hirsuta TaxID=260670 RepID=A0AA40BB69_9PEZI|nr:hypothetical protein B0H67DRAFT_58188 [Lasiosphaeris hirsuta]
MRHGTRLGGTTDPPLAPAFYPRSPSGFKLSQASSMMGSIQILTKIAPQPSGTLVGGGRVQGCLLHGSVFPFKSRTPGRKAVPDVPSPSCTDPKFSSLTREQSTARCRTWTDYTTPDSANAVFRCHPFWNSAKGSVDLEYSNKVRLSTCIGSHADSLRNKTQPG